MSLTLAQHILELSNRKGLIFSDIHIEEAHPVMMRTPAGWCHAGFDGDLTAADIHGLLKAFDEHWEPSSMSRMPQFEASATVKGVRLRCSAFCVGAGKRLAVSIRKFPIEPLPLEELGLPPSVDAFADAARGLLLVSGPTGSGKSTTLAAIIRRINETRAAHILTIEDPIEFVFRWDKSIVSQREVGKDVATFAEGLHGALRQCPDVILIGEIRDRDTADTALRAAESGHFVMATTHARSASMAIAKFLSFFPDEQSSKSLALSSALVGVISQALPPNISGSRSLAAEVLHATNPLVAKAVAERDFRALDEALKAGRLPQCTHLNTVLGRMVERKEISQEAALAASPRPEELREAMPQRPRP